MVSVLAPWHIHIAHAELVILTAAPTRTSYCSCKQQAVSCKLHSLLWLSGEWELCHIVMRWHSTVLSLGLRLSNLPSGIFVGQSFSWKQSSSVQHFACFFDCCCCCCLHSINLATQWQNICKSQGALQRSRLSIQIYFHSVWFSSVCVSRLTRSVLHYYIVCCFCLALSVCHCHWHGRVEHSASAPCHTDVLHRVQASERAPFCLQLVMRQQTIVYSFSNTTAKMRRLVATTAAMRHKRLPRDTVCLHSTRPPPVAPCFSADSSNFSISSGISSCYRQGILCSVL